ncbi:hypothetical protein TNIN_284341 [Trichonephila inaurata madagascariensis]|uniref:Prokineticin domain-containing protein n=1 Tax=Trichonephila inaurata madagascariensis TaxID=2747483 RepID=A0A8X6YFC3_9ARAC|nr:hypothetical protein TNIN_284341 [Trichonephila inaurata madagascariensis]
MKWYSAVAAIVFFISTMALVHVQSCLSESDCKEDECCAAPHPKALKYGTCLKLGKERDACTLLETKLVNYGGKYVRGCPCRFGFTCRSARGLKPLPGSLAIFTLKCYKATPAELEEATKISEGEEVFYEEIIEDGKVIEKKIID